jgi:carbon-monoxide dehydrogenase large subunit
MSEGEHPHGKPGQGVGARVPRKEDARHLFGKGKFVGDMSMPGLQEVAFLRSPVAHARIQSITKDPKYADRTFVREDMQSSTDIVADSKVPTYKQSSQPPLASGKVRFVGEPIAMCFADTRAEAEDLIETISVQMEDLPPIASVNVAKEQAPTNRVHEEWDDNTFMTLKMDKRFDELSANAPVVVHRTIDLARQCMVPMEGKAVLAYWDHQFDQLIVYAGTQVPHMIRTGLSLCLGLDQERIRVISPDVGGGFGYKCVLQQEEVCIAWLAMTFKKPFRFLEDRREHLVAGANSREHHYELTAYADQRGRLLALDAKIAIDGGAYSVWPFTVGLEPGQAIGNLPGPYAFDGYRCVTECVATNKPGFVPYRGVARTGVCFAIELLLDAVAREVGREPAEVRMENLVGPDLMPYINVANKHYDGGDYPESLRKAMEMADFPQWRKRQRESAQNKSVKRIGIGTATYTEQSAHGTSVFATWGTAVIPGFDSATIRITPDGALELRAGIHSHGQGMETSFAQIAHEILGIDIDRIKLIHGDTGQTPFSTGTYASRSLVMSGGAISRACKAVLPRLLKIGAHMMGVPVEEASRVGDAIHANTPNGPKSISIRQIADAWYVNPHLLPPDVDPAGLETTMGFKPAVDTGSFTYASHAVAVEVDTETGHVQILDYVIVEDCGTMINPMLVEGQTYGGVAQGIGTALYEEMPYDGNGTPLASTLADYILPGPTEIPRLRVHHTETPSPHTEFGAKGMGEGGAIAPPAVIFNAVNDALQDLGVELLHTPMTPRRVLEALASAKPREATPASVPAKEYA